MKKDSFNKIKLGIFVTIGIIILIAGIYYIGQTKKLFSSTFRVSALFKDVNGLQVGNNVRFAGINVGSIEGIEILTDTTVKVVMVVDVDVQKFIKKDSKAEIGTDGLMGNKLMYISPGTEGKAEIEDNDRIGITVPISYDEVLAKLKTTADNAALITNDLAEVMNSISTGKGTVGKLFMDPEFAGNIDKIFVNTATITNDLAGVSSSISSGKGTIGKLLYDPETARNIDQIIINVNDGTKSFKKTMDAAKNSWLLGSFFGGGSDDEEDEKLEKEQNTKDSLESIEKSKLIPKTQKEIEAEQKQKKKQDYDDKIEALKRNKAKEKKKK